MSLWWNDDGSGRQRWKILPCPGTAKAYQIQVEGGSTGHQSFGGLQILSSNRDGMNIDLFSHHGVNFRQCWLIEETSPGSNKWYVINQGNDLKGGYLDGNKKSKRYLSTNTEGDRMYLWHSDDKSGRQHFQLDHISGKTGHIRILNGINTEHVYATKTNGLMYYGGATGTSLSPVYGRAIQIVTAGEGRHLWHVNSGGNIYYSPGNKISWKHISGSLKYISVSKNNEVWGVNRHDRVYYRKGTSGGWREIGGRLKMVSVSDDGKHIWGCNSGDNIYYRNGENGNYVHIGGHLIQVDVSGDGSHVWGANRGGNIYYRNGKNGSWRGISKPSGCGAARHMAVSEDGTYVWATCTNNHAYKMTTTSSNRYSGKWINMHSSILQMSV